MDISLELVLGIIGSITGPVALAGLILKYRREKPKIKAELLEAKHFYQPRGENEKNYFLSVITTSRIRNTGDRGSTIGYAEIRFSMGNQQHKIREEHRERVGPHDFVIFDVSFQFPSSYEVHPEQKKIPFELTLYHAHGEIKLEGTSQKIKK